METLLSGLLCRVGSLRRDFKLLANTLSSAESSSLGAVLDILEKLNSLATTVIKLRSETAASRERDCVDGAVAGAELNDAVHHYQDVVCAEIPLLAPEWVVWRRGANSLQLRLRSDFGAAINENGAEDGVIPCGTVTLLFHADTDAVQVRFSLLAEGDVAGKAESYEFDPRVFVENLVSLLANRRPSNHRRRRGRPRLDLKPQIPTTTPSTSSTATVGDRNLDKYVSKSSTNVSVKVENDRHTCNDHQNRDLTALSWRETEGVDLGYNGIAHMKELSRHDSDFRLESSSGTRKLMATPKIENGGDESVLDEANGEFIVAGGDEDFYDEPEDFGDDDLDDFFPESPKKRRTSSSQIKLKVNGAEVEGSIPPKKKRGRKPKGFYDEPVAEASEEAKVSAKAKSATTKRAAKESVTPRKKLPPCRLCGVEVCRLAAPRHMKDVHGFSDPECCYCDKTFSAFEDLKKHVHALHNVGRWSKHKLPCKMCSVELCENQTVDHMRIEHSRPLECPYCDFGRSDQDPSQMAVDVMLQQMAVNVSPEHKLRRHIANDHFSKAFVRARCTYCHRSFKSREDLEEHHNRHVGEDDRATPLCKNLPTGVAAKDTKILCVHCGHSFSSSYLQTHINRMHDRERLFFKYECRFCDKRYEHPKRLRAHLLQFHFPEKRDMECALCGKKFASRRMLKQHEQTHFEARVACPHCDKMFRTRNNMKQHLLSHFPPQYECLGCSKKFVYRCGLKTHLIQVHKYVDWEKYVKKESRLKI